MWGCTITCILTDIFQTDFFNFFHEFKSNFQVFSLLDAQTRLGIVSGWRRREWNNVQGGTDIGWGPWLRGAISSGWSDKYFETYLLCIFFLERASNSLMRVMPSSKSFSNTSTL